MAAATPLTVLTRREEETWSAFARRVVSVQGEAIAIISAADIAFVTSVEERDGFLSDVAKIRYRVRLATRDGSWISAAKERGIGVYTTTPTLRYALRGHAELPQAIRLFSPHLWRQQWRSHLQRIGLLALPKMRIWVLGGLSALLFLFVVFRLLPSAEVSVVPRQETITYTSNIVLVLSGSSASAPSHVRTLPMVPVSVSVTKTIMFDQISEEFVGTAAETSMLITNNSDEDYSLKKGTRLTNQAGMVFRLKQAVGIPAHSTSRTGAKADPQDIYGQTVGERGNLPAGVRWDFPGLSTEERKSVYATNVTPSAGGRTATRKVLQPKDLKAASETLKTQLLAEAKTISEERRQAWTMQHASGTLEFLRKDDVIKKTFTGFVLPTNQLGKPVQSIQVSGTLVYTMYGYDISSVLSLLKQDIEGHAVEGKRVLFDSLTSDRLRVYIIDFDDNLSWIKITADLLGLQEFILDPLTPTGARFGKRVRETVAGLPKTEAERIVRNFAEVERVSIRLWPPWAQRVPEIPSNISIVFPE